MIIEPRDILLVADDPAFAAFVEPLLRDQGCKITRIGNATKALHVLDSLRFDLVITSLVASEMDEIEFLHALTARTADTPVIAIDVATGDLMEGTLTRVASALGAAGVVLSAPVGAEDLINTVHILMAGIGATDDDRTSITYH